MTPKLSEQAASDMKKVGLYTLGCKVAQYETEAMSERFAAEGYEVSNFGEVCDVYVVNTCTVTAESDRKCRQVIRRAARQNPLAKILVCGCYSQRSAEELEGIDCVSAVIGSADKLSLVSVANRLLSGLSPFPDKDGRIRVTDIDAEPFEKMEISSGPRTRVYVKIEDGCECRCTYCAIPSARGRVRSRPRSEVIEEVHRLGRSGVAEVVLTGIETGSYGADFEDEYRLKDLLAELDSLKLVPRIRLGSLAPELVGKSFCDGILGLSTLAPHFHISIQSGSDTVLRAMKRRYTASVALENIERLRKCIPGATFTTDLMVGFPGESESDFLKTVEFVSRAGFLDCHVFAYSKRRGTPAYDFENQVSEDVKKDRSQRLIAACFAQRENQLAKIIDKREPLSCLMESERNGVYTAHSDNFVEVKIDTLRTKYDGDNLHGKIKKVLPVSQKDGIIIGKILD